MNKTLLKTTAILLFLNLSGKLFCQNVGINVTGALPSSNAILDLNTGNANNVGLIIPNVNLGASLSTFNPPMANAPNATDIGMMVYNMISTNQPVGYYYWNGTTWVNVSGATATLLAQSGTSVIGSHVVFGNPFGGNTAQFTQNTEVPLGGFNLTFSNVGGNGNVGIDLGAATSAAQALEIGQTTNTIRVNGLKAGATFNSSSVATTNYMVYANTTGDLYSIPNPSTNGYILTWSSVNGPTWQAGASGGVTSVTGTAPVVVSPTTGAAVVSLQGAAGTVCYGTGGGSNFTAAGVAPTSVTYATPSTPLTAQVLVSNGAGAPTWNYAGGATLICYKGFTANAEAALAAYTEANLTGWWSSCYDALYGGSSVVTQIRMPHCVVTNLHVVPNANATSKSTTWKVNNETQATNFSGILPAATATSTNFPGTLAFSDGDLLDVSTTWQAGSTGAISIIKIEVQYYLLP